MGEVGCRLLEDTGNIRAYFYYLLELHLLFAVRY